MPEKDTIFSSAIKYTGNFNFKEFYQFCYDWITEQTGMSNLAELEYSEKINGDSKDIDIQWLGSKKFTDYFKFELQAKFRIIALKKGEIVRDRIKISTNNGQVKLTVKGNLIRDYDGKFETGGRLKLLRGMYEKFVIPTRVEQFEDVVATDCDEFLTQAKAFLDLEGRK
jgi:hypothetical protein